MSALEFSQLLGNYGEFLGAIAIVVTLIYLAVQLKQNTAIVRANAYQGWSASNVEINLAMSNPDQSQIMIAGMRDSTNLTDETFIAFGMMHMAVMQMAQSTDYMYRSGLLDRELWEAEMNRVAGNLDLTGVRQWWDAGGRTQLTPRFVELLESTQSSIAVWGWDAERGFFQRSRPLGTPERT